MERLLQDIRYGLRQLLRKPGFAALAIISMALGIGANTSIFSLLDTVMFRPLPVHGPARLVQLFGTEKKGSEVGLSSYLNYKDYRDRNTVLSGLSAYAFVVSSLSDRGKNERVWGYLVTGNYFDVLGVKPALGRTFLPEEDATPNSHPVAILSHASWERRFGSNPAIIGQTVQFNGHPFTVVGVAPKGFTGTEVAFTPEMWIPMMMAGVIEPGSKWLERRANDNLFVVGRLKPGVTEAQARAELDTITAQLGQDYPENAGRGIQLGKPGLFLPEIRNAVFGFAGILTVVGGLVLLLACVNLANLLLARATERRKELAVRLADRRQPQPNRRQLLTESLLISLAGGAAGIGLAWFINSTVRNLRLPTEFAVMFDLRMDWRVLTFTLLLSVATGILFSLIPALQSSKPQLVPALKTRPRWPDSAARVCGTRSSSRRSPSR
jgi:predicted permease